MTSERGQTSAEIAGLLVLIGLVFGALHATDVGATVAGRAGDAICQITGGDCEEPAAGGGDDDPDAAPAAPTPAPEPVEGGAGIGAGLPIPVLPFPGSVSATCIDSAAGGRQDCRGTEGPVDAGVRATGTVSRSPERLNARGCAIVRLSATAALEAYGSFEGSRGSGGGGVSASAGVSAQYEVSVSPERAEAIASGDEDLPNPLDPRTLGTGEGIELSERYYEGVELTASYRALQAQLGFSEGRRASAGVLRVDADTVRIVAGDAQYVSQALSAGVGLDGASVSVTAGTEESEGRLQAVDLDVSTPEGWAAYQAFVQSGELPDASAPGTSNETTSETWDRTQNTSAGVEAGPFAATVTIADGEQHVTQATGPGGVQTSTLDVRRGEVGVQAILRQDADGRPEGSSYAINLQDVSAETAEQLSEIAGWPTARQPDGSVRVEFTRGDLTAIQNRAADLVIEQFEEQGAEPPSREDVLSQLSEPTSYVDGPDGFRVDVTEPALSIASAARPEEILQALAFTNTSDGESAAYGLTTFANLTGGDLPGRPVQPACA